MKKQFFLFIIIGLLSICCTKFGFSQQLNIDVSQTPENIITNIFVKGPVTPSGIVQTGSLESICSFSSSENESMMFPSGMLLSTGKVSNAVPNGLDILFSDEFATSGDADLNGILLGGETTTDASTIQFSIVPNVNSIDFSYIFASEEYGFQEDGFDFFNDIAGIFITGPNPDGGDYVSQNIATIGTNNLPISIFSINKTENSNLYLENLTKDFITFSGYTKILSSSVKVVSGQNYTIKLAIADAVDKINNSAIFLKPIVFPTPITMSYTGKCLNSPVKFSLSDASAVQAVESVVWNFGDNSATSTELEPSHIYTAAGTYSVEATIEFNNGSNPTTLKKTLKFNDFPKPNIGNDSLCATFPINLNPGNFATYRWQDGSDSSIFVVNNAGNFSVTVTDDAGCSASSNTIRITEGVKILSFYKEDPNCNNNDSSFCSITVAGTSYLVYLDGQSQGNTTTFTNLSNDNHKIRITNNEGCSDSVSFYISKAPDSLYIYVNKVFNNSCGAINEGKVEISAIGGTSPYTFAVGLGTMTGSEGSTVEFSDLYSNTYAVTVTDINGCIEDETFTVITEPCFGIPNFFTPNGDGINDVWKLSAPLMYPNCKINIFDRYGRLIKTFSSSSDNWDGTINGVPLPSDSYWYAIDLLGDGSDIKKGHITIVRK